MTIDSFATAYWQSYLQLVGPVTHLYPKRNIYRVTEGDKLQPSFTTEDGTSFKTNPQLQVVYWHKINRSNLHKATELGLSQ